MRQQPPYEVSCEGAASNSCVQKESTAPGFHSCCQLQRKSVGGEPIEESVAAGASQIFLAAAPGWM